NAVAAAYDAAAGYYDQWLWQTFWERNELPLLRRAIAHCGRTRRAIDIGTGTGRYAQALAEAGLHTIGTDVSRAMLAVARHRRRGLAHFIHADAGAPRFETRQFDLAIAARVLCHVADAAAVLRDTARIVRQGGQLIVSELDDRHGYTATMLPTAAG